MFSKERKSAKIKVIKKRMDMKNHLKAQARDGGQGVKAIRREEKKKKKTKMLVSGKSVFKIRDIIIKKSK